MTNPKVSIIIPTSGNNPQLQKCLKSIKNQNYPSNKIETLVITNKDLQKQGKSFSFASAVNTASKKASGEYLLITNDDIILKPNAIKSWTKEATRKPQTIFGAKLKLIKNKSPAPAGYNMNLWTGIAKPVYTKQTPTPCHWVSGCTLFVSLPIWKNLNGFDESFSPGYFEDADFCLRARTKNINCLLLPQAQALHAQTSTFNINKPKKYEHWYRNKILFLRKHATPLQLSCNLFLQYALFTPTRAFIKRDGRLFPALKGLFWNIKTPQIS